MVCTHNSERNIYVPEKGEPGDYEDSHMETVYENYQVDIDLR